MINKNYIKTYTAIFKKILLEKTGDYFDESALPSYSHTNKLASTLFWNRIKVALAMPKKLRGSKVLDFGCGGGVTFLHLKEQGCSITACEKEFYQITEQVNQALDTGATIKTDLLEIDGKFDYIFALDVLEHIEDLDNYLTKLIELCGDNGKIIVSGPTENILYKAGRKIAGFSGHYHKRNIDSIEKKIMENGLKLCKRRCLYFPFTLFKISMWSVDNTKK